ncbi:STAS-like domain-containing protein [Cupriavidus sp. YAF13]|uniref:STAS-like domain-containing protein n=1 Tax=Cupriavidus sp. YAF13 TaxID=3233075 RepID=UPI003F8DC0E9
MMKTIRVADEFSRYPAGRYLSDGPYSGERFREEMLVPIINVEDDIVIELDGARAYGSSFLEEAFGGLIRECRTTKERALKVLKLHSKRASLVTEILGYISDAKPRLSGGPR